MELSKTELDYLGLLAKQYPSIRAASTALIELKARLNLPKGTEHFISDIHGEYESFRHVLKNGSGSIKRKIDENFPDLSGEEKKDLATLVYYPEQKLPLLLNSVENKPAWYRDVLLRLIKLGQLSVSKYTRHDVRAALPEHLATIVEELLYGREDVKGQRDYYQSVITSIIDTDSARDFIIAIAELVQRLAVARLHIIGDVYDRGPGADRVMDLLLNYHNVDIQWGNHDTLWMGGAAGSEACIANVIRISLRYSNTETLENGYGISLLPLASFAMEVYSADPCERFLPKSPDIEVFTTHEILLMARMQKAIAVIQFKLESQIIQRRPHYEMDDRLLLDKIDLEKGTIQIDGTTYPLLDTYFPTIDPVQPFALSEREQMVMDKLRLSFANSQRLQQHVRFLYSKGSMYLVYNGNLLFHGCIAMNTDGSFREFKIDGNTYAARDFMDRLDRLARQGYFADDPDQKQYGMDAMWYLWSGPQSPLYGKDKMATFERYFIADDSTHTESRNPYYTLRDREEIAVKILQAFDVDPVTGHIINGHVPVKVKRGESPVKANGRLIVIDGGFAEAYQPVTGIAGYTLIFNSYGLLLASHNHFESVQKAVEGTQENTPRTKILESNVDRLRVRDADLGRKIQAQIDDLQLLIKAYRDGLLKES
ncbi:MAG: fructose-1,6-bisphosphatase [Chloroflexi bacterium]|nr:fructose-1,6-bisphosphatase [Chloroflexota bacterium]